MEYQEERQNTQRVKICLNIINEMSSPFEHSKLCLIVEAKITTT